MYFKICQNITVSWMTDFLFFESLKEQGLVESLSHAYLAPQTRLFNRRPKPRGFFSVFLYLGCHNKEANIENE